MLPRRGKVDEAAGEFWVENPFLMPRIGQNLSAYERNCVYLNRSGRDFLDVSFTSGADIDADSRSVVAADFDRDGRVDLLVGSVGGGPLRLFRNNFPQPNWLRLELQGTTSNRQAIGSRVIVECGQQRIVRDLFAANGFMGQGPAELLIGLGSANSVERLTIRWPSGRIQTLTNLPVNRVVRVIEGDGERTAP